jgi:hypothetical protein
VHYIGINLQITRLFGKSHVLGEFELFVRNFFYRTIYREQRSRRNCVAAALPS